jgi:hypothetical protein
MKDENTDEEDAMKGRCVAFVVFFCVASLIVSTGFAKGKPPKPDKPDTPGQSKGECIKFSGDLQSAGETIIEGCCPNAGPWPAYTMTLATDSPVDGTAIPGYLFIGSYGTPAPYEGHKVQFWTWDVDSETPGTGDFFFEIRGGTAVSEKVKNHRILTVNFVDETATGWIYYTVTDPYCEPCDTSCDPCYEFDPVCNPCTDPDCEPCIEQIEIPNVTFELIRTSDQSYCADGSS